MLNVRILGPLWVGTPYVNAVPSAQKPRTVLALLVLRHDCHVTTESLISELWGEHVPRSSLSTLHTYILQIRKSLAGVLGLSVDDVAARILKTLSGGYVMHADSPCDVDLGRMYDLQKQAATAIGRDDLGLAAERLHEGLGIWRGPTLADVSPGRQIDAEVVALEQVRLTMLEYRIEVELRLGLHRHLLGDLAALTRLYPQNEGLAAQYMLSLHRCGLQSQALEVFRNLRAALVGDLGIEPSAIAQDVFRSILSPDTAGLSAAGVVSLPTGPHSVKERALVDPGVLT